MKISGSIYSDKKRTLKETVRDLEVHQVDMLHVDCNDDISVFEDIAKIRSWCNSPIDLHIITETPEKYFELLKENPVEYVTFQYENLKERLFIPKDIPGQKGLAITTPTPVDVFKYYEDFDFILIMATIPGQSGGTFDSHNFRKIREFQKMYPEKNVHVDGGVNGEVSFILRNMGVHSSVSGSFLFKGASIGQALMDLTKRNLQSQFKVRDFMIPLDECPHLQLDDLDLRTILESIDKGKQGLTLVLDGSKFVGIVSNADVRKVLIKHFDNLKDVNPESLINKKPITVMASANVDEMLKIVRQQSFPIMYMPVVNNEQEVEGIVSFINLIKGEI